MTATTPTTNWDDMIDEYPQPLKTLSGNTLTDDHHVLVTQFIDRQRPIMAWADMKISNEGFEGITEMVLNVPQLREMADLLTTTADALEAQN